MSMSAPEVAPLLAAVAALMVAVHTLDTLFAPSVSRASSARSPPGSYSGPTRSGSWTQNSERRLVPARPRTMRQALRGATDWPEPGNSNDLLVCCRGDGVDLFFG